MDIDLVYVATEVHEAAILLIEMLKLLTVAYANMSCVLLEDGVVRIVRPEDKVGADPALSNLGTLVCVFVHVVVFLLVVSET